MNLFCFGFGDSARTLARGIGRDWTIAGTSRDPARVSADARPVFAFDAAGTTDHAGIAATLREADALLISIPPHGGQDAVLHTFAGALRDAPRLRRIIYLSTVGVYGDTGGAWIDETAVRYAVSPRNQARILAEDAWAAFAEGRQGLVSVLRLAGIYGPGRNALVNMRDGTARHVVKPNQVFNRIHVADIAAAIAAVLAADTPPAAVNVTDDEPAPPQDVVLHAAHLMGRAPPPATAFDPADLSPMARDFWSANKRIANARLHRLPGFSLTYPTFREGLAALWAAGEGR